MMSDFKYCPMCGTKRDDDCQFCKNCNFEFLVGKYVKLDEEIPSQDEEVNVEKVSQEEFVESNDILKQSRSKINYCVAKYLNNELDIQYNGKYDKIIDISITEYISCSLNNTVYENLSGDCLKNIDKSIHDEKFIESKNIFIQWILENRGILPGSAISQYKDPIQMNVDNLEKLLSLYLVDSEDNKKFINLLNEYLNFENEFLENLI